MKPGPVIVDPKERFARYFVPGGDGCWEWQGNRTPTGYGQFYAGRYANGKRRAVQSHRFSYEIHVGLIPDGLQVLHRCDNPPCVNPDHLFLGTRSDNMRDMMLKGRGRPAGKRQLSRREVQEIQATPKTTAYGEVKKIADRYGVTQNNIKDIWAGKTWSFLCEEINMTSKYVQVKFRPEDTRSYTYLLDGHACEIGDAVKVPDNKSDGWKRVTVTGFSDEDPKFLCKPILGLAPAKEDAPIDLAEAGDMWSRDIDPEELF